MQVLQSGEWTHTQFHNDPKIPVVDGSIVDMYLVTIWYLIGQFGISTIIEPK